MSRHALPVGVPCALCPGRRIGSWSETAAEEWAADCGHTLTQITAVARRILASAGGQAIGTPITSRDEVAPQ